MKVQRVPKERLHDAPVAMKSMVGYLNELLACDPRAISDLLNHAVVCSSRVDTHSDAIPRELDGHYGLSALGVLHGFVRSSRYLLTGLWDDTTEQFTEFYVAEEVE